MRSRWTDGRNEREYFIGHTKRGEVTRAQQWGIEGTYWMVRIDRMYMSVRFDYMEDAMAYVETVVALKE